MLIRREPHFVISLVCCTLTFRIYIVPIWNNINRLLAKSILRSCKDRVAQNKISLRQLWCFRYFRNHFNFHLFTASKSAKCFKFHHFLRFHGICFFIRLLCIVALLFRLYLWYTCGRNIEVCELMFERSHKYE